jgi:hypothetical protein
MTIEEIWVGENDVRRKLEGKELEAFLAMRKEIADSKLAEAAAEEAKATAKAALLNRLGITADEASLLLGGN